MTAVSKWVSSNSSTLLHSLSNWYPGKRYVTPYPNSYRLDITTAVLQLGWLLHYITHEGLHVIKQRNRTVSKQKSCFAVVKNNTGDTTPDFWNDNIDQITMRTSNLKRSTVFPFWIYSLLWILVYMFNLTVV